MITIEEIRKQADNYYKQFLIDLIENKDYNPIEIRFGKVKSKDLTENPFKISDGIKRIRSNSKQVLGSGYIIDFKIQNNQQFGKQEFPDRIFFETETDYLKFIKKEKEVTLFKENVKLILSFSQILKEFLMKFPLKVVENEKKWTDLLKVCNYFLQKPKPNLYIRELPIKVHTKFIEQNKGILTELLNILLPETSINSEFKEFEKRFGLKYNQSRVRFRILDKTISEKYFSGIADIEVNQSDFDNLNLPCKNVFVIENKTNFSNIMNFLTLPQLDSSMVIFGSGFHLGVLKNANWLNEKEIYYWGDIDAHGLQILSKIKEYFPNTKQIMMDFETLNYFKDECGEGKNTNVSELLNLNEEEFKLFNYLKENNLRLEQEKITQGYVLKYLSKISIP